MSATPAAAVRPRRIMIGPGRVWVRPEHFIDRAHYLAWLNGTPLKREDGPRRGRGAPSRRVRDRVLARDGYRCAGCGATDVALTCDHFPVPWICGGSAHPANLRAACARCNSAAGAHGVVATLPGAPAATSSTLEW